MSVFVSLESSNTVNVSQTAPTVLSAKFDSNPIGDAPRQKRMRVSLNLRSFEHSHVLSNIDSLFNECFECMECSARFEVGDQLLQHLDTHQHFMAKGDAKDEEMYDCSLCTFSLEKVRDMMSESEIKEALEKHTILEHFKAKIPPILMEPPAKITDDSPVEVGLPNINSSGVFKCSVCTKTFDQLYQRRIHERYNHQDSVTRNVAEMKKLIKCPTCKTLCKNEKQFKLHREMYCDVGFPCQQCTERFAKITQLASHMKLKHGAIAGVKTREIFIPVNTPDEDQTIAPTRHKCVICGVIPNSGEDLVVHILNRHKFDITTIKQAQCDKCPLRAPDVKTFADHYRRLHCN